MTERDRRATASTGDVARAVVRETYEEYDLGAVRVSMIADPENEHAWIQSDRTLTVRR